MALLFKNKITPLDHAPTEREVSLLAGLGVDVAQGGGTIVVGVPVGADFFIEEHAVGVVKDKGANRLARMLTRMPDKQVTILVAAKAATIKPRTLKGRFDACLSRADHGPMWTLERVLELLGTADYATFIYDSFPSEHLPSQLYQRKRVSFSTKADGL